MLYLIYIKQLFTNPFSSYHFQTKDSSMHVYAHSWLSNNGDRKQQNNQLLGLFLLYHETTTLLACFFYDTNFILINKLSNWCNVFLVASTFLYGRFCINKFVCLDMHRFSSLDDWLCNLISENCNFC